MLRHLILLIAFGFCALCMNSQIVPPQREDSLSLQQLPSNYLDKVYSKSNLLEQKLDEKSEKALQRMMKLEERIKRKMNGIDSSKVIEIFGYAEQRYKDLEQRLQSSILSKNYIASLDTLSTSLKFLQQNPQLISKTKETQQKLKAALSKVNGLENQFQKAEEIKKFLKERKEFLKDQLGKFGFAKELKRLNKQIYYYSEQLSEYKALLRDHKKAERKALELLSKTKLFKSFMRKNSMLASLFRLPGDPNDPTSQVSLAGLQTRTQVNNLIQQQIAVGGANSQQQFQQNMQEAQSKMNELKNKITQLGGSSSDMEMPEGFRKNDQKVKSFLKRLEYGFNIQTQKATSFFPITSDLGLSIAYKWSDTKIIGIGASYKVGMGRGWNHIRITHEGIGLRTHADVKLKGSFWISGGYEQNYKTAFSDFSQLRDRSYWQTSGLIGLSKIVSIKSKFFKKTKLQFLWDFMSYEQVPRTQPVLLRVGYNF